MNNNHRAITILMADDDPDDRMLTRVALTESLLLNELETVEDGQDLMDYLLHRGKFSGPAARPRPGLILLDLNMPRKDGREALKEIKEHPELRSIPVIVMTTSKAEEDILSTYNLGVNSFITKPVSFKELVGVLKALGKYWFQVVRLPNDNPGFN